MMKKANLNYRTAELCKVFNVTPSSYYYKPVGLSDNDVKLMTLIKIISQNSGQTYGKRRIRAQLKMMGYHIGLRKTQRLMKQVDIVVIRPRKRHYYPDCGQEHKHASNLLQRQFNPPHKNTHWVGDIAYIRHYRGWNYLACVMDLKTKEIVGHAMPTSPNAKLAKEALINAIKRQNPDIGQLLFHSDQGTQYSAREFRDALTIHGMTQSPDIS